MKTRLVRIGNSRGIRLPKPVIEEAGLGDEVELLVRDGEVVIAPARSPRSGWAQAAKHLRETGQDHLLDSPATTRFEEATSYSTSFAPWIRSVWCAALGASPPRSCCAS